VTRIAQRHHVMRRIGGFCVLSSTILLTLGAAVDDPVAAQSSGDAPAGDVSGVVDVVEVSGLVDPVVVDFVEQALATAADDAAEAVILQMNTAAAVVSDAAIERLIEQIAESPVPVAVWVGPSGSQLTGTPAQLAAVADAFGMAPNTRFGDLGEPLAGVAYPDGFAELAGRTASAADIRDDGLFVLGPNPPGEGTPTLGDMLVAINGIDARTPADGDGTIDTARTVQTADGPRQEVTVQARFNKLGLVGRLMHTVASPPVAYLLLVIGLMLLMFELFTAGVGIAGVTGAVCLVLGCYGAAALPTRWWAFALLVASVVAFAIDIQTGVARVWTGIGVAMFVVASLLLFDGLSISWVTLLAGIGGMLLAVLAGMPSMVRTRFATPTIGREWLIGEEGSAVTAVSPDGTVRIREATWPARTNRATPIEAGAEVRVVAIDGVILEVEPQTGGARDYRERRARS
jgi:membrane-bound serine protease (ClpP class)